MPSADLCSELGTHEDYIPAQEQYTYSLCHDAEFGNVHENMAITITAVR